MMAMRCEDDHGILAYLQAHPRRSISAARIARDLGLTCQAVAQFMRQYHGSAVVEVAHNRHRKYYKWGGKL